MDLILILVIIAILWAMRPKYPPMYLYDKDGDIVARGEVTGSCEFTLLEPVKINAGETIITSWMPY